MINSCLVLKIDASSFEFDAFTFKENIWYVFEIFLLQTHCFRYHVIFSHNGSSSPQIPSRIQLFVNGIKVQSGNLIYPLSKMDTLVCIFGQNQPQTLSAAWYVSLISLHIKIFVSLSFPK